VHCSFIMEYPPDTALLCSLPGPVRRCLEPDACRRKDDNECWRPDPSKAQNAPTRRYAPTTEESTINAHLRMKVRKN